MELTNAAFQLLTLNLVDTLALMIHSPFLRATVDVAFEAGALNVTRIAADSTLPFAPPGDVRLGAAAAGVVARRLNELLVATRRGPLNHRLVCERSELGACSVDIGSSRVLTCDADLGREQSVNQILMDIVAKDLARSSEARARFQSAVTGGEQGPFAYQFDGPTEVLRFTHGARRTSRRGVWLGLYSKTLHCFRWIWAEDEAPAYVKRCASKLPELASAPGLGCLRMAMFLGHPTFVEQALHVGARMLGAETIFSVPMDEFTTGYFAVFAGAPEPCPLCNGRGWIPATSASAFPSLCSCKT